MTILTRMIIMNYRIEYEDDCYEEDDEFTLSKNKILTKKKSLEDWIKEKILNNFINDEIQFSS